MTTSHAIRYSGALLLTVSLFLSCHRDKEPVAPQSKTASDYDASVVLQWSALQLDLTQHSPGFSPPVASRAMGYAGLTLYEAVVPGIPDRRSLAGHLNGLGQLPQADHRQTYHWAAVANAAEAEILRNLYANTSSANKTRIDSLESGFLKDWQSRGAETAVLERSADFGKQIAHAIFDWSKTDGGHEGYLRNFPATYKSPIFNGAWQKTENGRAIPLQPYWGSVRPFVTADAMISMPHPLPVSSDVKSQYFAQYLEVYTKNKSLTQAEKEISVWWADDPSETFTPPGHSYNLARIAIRTANSNLAQAAEVLARTGIAVADAFIDCWKCKYMFNNERPYTFVRRAIDPNWIPFWPAPPFPGYSSGHSTQSAATALVLTNVYGERFTFTDDSHINRVRDNRRNTDFKARSFRSFWEAAEESAYSRFLGGIHTRQDNEVGLRTGQEIGRNINALPWKKSQ